MSLGKINAAIGDLKTAIQAASPEANDELIRKQYELAGLTRALMSAGQCPPLQEKISALRIECQSAPRVVAAHARHPGTREPVASPAARIVEARAFMEGMRLANKVTHPEYLRTIELVRMYRYELAQQQG